MSELPDGIEPAPIPEPKDSALGIVARRDAGGAFELLLGLRSRTTRFMPANLAFPGGRVEPADEPARPGALERCASREILEETSVGVPPEAWIDAGERTTPPFFAVRFRTRFFVAEVPRGTEPPAIPPQPEELESVAFRAPDDVVASWEEGRATVPPPLLPILRALVAHPPLSIDALAAAVRRVNGEERPSPRIEFVPGIWALPLRTRTLPPASCTNVWMPGGNRFVVVDPGSEDAAELKTLLAVVRKRERTGAAPVSVVLTHHHRDHLGGAAAIAQALSLPIRAHPETLARLPVPARRYAGEPIEDGRILDLDGMTLQALHTPGHAPGHLAFFEPRHRVLIAGDLVSGLSTILVGFADGSMEEYLASLARTAALDVRTVLPAHGPPLPGKALDATRLHREQREARILAALGAAPRDLEEIARDAYADAPDAPEFLRTMQTRAHLARLQAHGRARAHGAGGRAWSTS